MLLRKLFKAVCLALLCAGCSDTDPQTANSMNDTGNPLGGSTVSDADFRANEINGSVVSTVENFDSAGNLTVRANYVFNQADSSISQRSLDNSGATTETHRFFLDKRGLVTQVNVLNEGDDSIVVQTLERDVAGRLLRFEGPVIGDTSEDTEIYEYRYENNRIVSRTQSFGDSDKQVEGEFFYGDLGQLERIAFTDSDSGDTNTIFFTNNAQGQSVKSEVDALTDGTVDLTLLFLYDDAGNVTTIDRFNRNNALISRRVFTYESTDLPVTNILNYALFYFP